MVRLKRPELAADARRINREQLARIGGEIKAWRLRRRWTQQHLARLAGVSRELVGRIEHGDGGGVTFDGWQRVTLALGRPIRFDLGRDPLEMPADVGHLDGEELVLRLARPGGWLRRVELPIKPGQGRHAFDVALIDRARTRLILIQVWNTFGDLGSAARGFTHELAVAEQVAGGLGMVQARVAGCWAIVDTARNRALVGRYPEFFATRFPGSSVGWVRAITTGTEPPGQAGIVWLDTRRGQIVARRSATRRPAARSDAHMVT